MNLFLNRKIAALPPVLAAFALWSAGLTAASLVFSFVCGQVFHLKYPYAFPLFHPDLPFWDFTVFAQRFAHFRQSDFWAPFNYPFTYPPASAVAFAFFYSLPHPLATYLTFCVIALVTGAIVSVRALVRHGISPVAASAFVSLSIVTCWPIGYLFNRANIEGLVAFILALGVACFLYRRWWLGATLVAIAGAMKIFPAVLLALLLSRRRYWEFAWGVVVMLALTVLSLKFLGPSTRAAGRQIGLGLQFFQAEWAGRFLPTEIGFDHSAFTLFKMPYGIWSALHHGLIDFVLRGGSPDNRVSSGQHLQVLLTTYTVIAGVGGLVLYFGWIRRLPFLNQLLALSVCAVTLPPVSFDYTLVHLLLPFGVLCIYATSVWRSGQMVPGLRLSFLAFAVVFTTGAFLTYGDRWAGQVRAVALLVLLAAVVRLPFVAPQTLGLPPALSE